MWILYVFFAISSVVGAWLAWRRNPLYTLRKTLQVVVVFVVGIALFAVAIDLLFARINRAHLGLGASVTILLTVSLGAALAVSLYAIRASVPRVELPAATTLVNVNRRRVGRWLKPLVIFNGLFLIPGLVTFLMHSDWWYAFVPLGGILDLIAVIVLVSVYFQARIADRALTALQLDPWIAWQFTPAQWQVFTEAQVAQTAAAIAAQRAAPRFHVRQDWKSLVAPGLVLAVLAFLFRREPWGLLLAVLALATVGTVVFLSDRHNNNTAVVNRRKKLNATAPEVFFGSSGVFAEGDYTPWLTISSFLTDAWCTPTTLMLRFNKQVPSRFGSNTVMEEKTIPLPPNPQSDLASLQRHLTVLCPIARIALTQGVLLPSGVAEQQETSLR